MPLFLIVIEGTLMQIWKSANIVVNTNSEIFKSALVYL